MYVRKHKHSYWKTLRGKVKEGSKDEDDGKSEAKKKPQNRDEDQSVNQSGANGELVVYRYRPVCEFRVS